MAPILPATDKSYHRGLMWFRRDLRIEDNAALALGLRECVQLFCVFVFDSDILDPLPRRDRRVEFIRQSLVQLDAALRAHGGGLLVRHAFARREIPALAQALAVQAVYANRDYEPDAIERDAQVTGALAERGIAWHPVKDQAIFECDELLTRAGQPYSVFTPYRRAWLAKARPNHFEPHASKPSPGALTPPPAEQDQGVPTLADIGFETTNLAELSLPAGMSGGASLWHDFLKRRLASYHRTRDYPAVRGPSYLGVHLRFGTVSIRRLAGTAHALACEGNAGASIWLSELIWRDFYFQVLAHHPRVARGASFRPEYDGIAWRRGKGADRLFAAWCEGRTGYPLVDAAMAQINGTGYMHNRLRMVTASFLCKHLGLDWRRGEAYFALHLNDFELSSNNGGWQWASSSGCDAQPWFRIFNPVTQSRRFDPEGRFIRRYLPQLAKLSDDALHAPWLAAPEELKLAGVRLGDNYPAPIADHARAREQAMQRYAAVRSTGRSDLRTRAPG